MFFYVVYLSESANKLNIMRNKKYIMGKVSVKGAQIFWCLSSYKTFSLLSAMCLVHWSSGISAGRMCQLCPETEDCIYNKNISIRFSVSFKKLDRYHNRSVHGSVTLMKMTGQVIILLDLHGHKWRAPISYVRFRESS